MPRNYYYTKSGDTQNSIKEVFIPVGLGFKVNLGSNVNLDLGYQVNFVQYQQL
jgi:OOP family OmpA-OmpF porin